MPSSRPFDIVLFGATGFVGQLTAEYLARRTLDQPTRWAIAGRNMETLQALRERLVEINPGCAVVGVLEANVERPESLVMLANQTRVLATTVGPYARYGEPVVKACVEQGTDYLDLTGEPAFVNRVLERYDDPAREHGVRIVNCCGFDSIPHDLGVLFTVNELPQDRPMKIEGFVHSRGAFSGGTWHSAVNAMAQYRETRRPRRNKSVVKGQRRATGLAPRIFYQQDIEAWACPLPTIDPAIVLRSARELPQYGPDFRYGHYVQVKKLTTLTLGVTTVGGIFALAQLGPTRRWLLNRVQPGAGPSLERRSKSFFTVTFVGEAGDQRVMTEVSGGDPGYGETAKMLSEAALCLAHDALPRRAGVLTPAVAMGWKLIERLDGQGIRFEVLDREPPMGSE